MLPTAKALSELLLARVYFQLSQKKSQSERYLLPLRLTFLIGGAYTVKTLRHREHYLQ